MLDKQIYLLHVGDDIEKINENVKIFNELKYDKFKDDVYHGPIYKIYEEYINNKQTNAKAYGATVGKLISYFGDDTKKYITYDKYTNFNKPITLILDVPKISFNFFGCWNSGYYKYFGMKNTTDIKLASDWTN